MARAAIARRTSAPIIVAGPATRARIARVGRGAARAAAAAARDEAHTITALAAAAAAGWMARTGTSLPHVESLGIPGTYALGAWFLGRVTRSRVLSHVATGLASIAVYDLARGDIGSTTTSDRTEGMHGEI